MPAIRATVVLPPQQQPHATIIAVREAHHPDTVPPLFIECHQPEARSLEVGTKVAAVVVKRRDGTNIATTIRAT